MEQILIQYRNSQTLLKNRIAEIRLQMRDPMLSAAQSDALEARRRMLVEEVYEQEQIIQCISEYLSEKSDAEGNGDVSCA